MTTREDSIAAVMAAASAYIAAILDPRNHPALEPVAMRREHKAAIEQALKDERIRTLEAVWRRMGSAEGAMLALSRMLAEARGETA